MSQQFRFEIDENTPVRLDKFLVGKFPDKTRQFLQKLIKENGVRVNGKSQKPGYELMEGDKVIVIVPVVKTLDLKPVNIPLNILYEDKNVLVINKQPGLVVHPGAHESHQEDSLVNAILFHCGKELGAIGGVARPGIVHRLDKDTSGVMIIAKNDSAQQDLMKQFKNRTVSKNYLALVYGKLDVKTGTIDAPIGRDPRYRQKMAVVSTRLGKSAITKFEVLKQYDDVALVKVALMTGRTHQIRVHFSSIGHPLVGDSVYGKTSVNKKFKDDFGLNRIFLHSNMLVVSLPSTTKVTKKAEFIAPLPNDLQTVLDQL